MIHYIAVHAALVLGAVLVSAVGFALFRRLTGTAGVTIPFAIVTWTFAACVVVMLW